MTHGNPWGPECDEGYWPDDELPGWEEIGEFSGPEYFMYREEADKESSRPTWRSPSAWMPPQELPRSGGITVETPKDWFMC